VQIEARYGWFSAVRLAGRKMKEAPKRTPLSRWSNGVFVAASRQAASHWRIRRGVFRSIADLQTAINAYLAEHNTSPKSFVWTQSADAILAKLDRLPIPSV
jgi:hypothetical protein